MHTHILFSRLRVLIVQWRSGVGIIADANGGSFVVRGKCGRCLHCRRIDKSVGECEITKQFRSLGLLRLCDDFFSGIRIL